MYEPVQFIALYLQKELASPRRGAPAASPAPPPTLGLRPAAPPLRRSPPPPHTPPHPSKVRDSVAVHVPCSSKKLKLGEQMVQLAELCATDVHATPIPCCGMAGDRGMRYPELTGSSLQHLDLPASCTDGYSTSRTCEMSLSNHSGINFRSLLYLVDEAPPKRKAAAATSAVHRAARAAASGDSGASGRRVREPSGATGKVAVMMQGGCRTALLAPEARAARTRRLRG